MPSTHKSLRSSTTDKRPTTAIADGQIAINTNVASAGLFFKDSTGASIIKVGPVHVGPNAPNASPAVGGSSGNSTGEVWLDNSLTPVGVKIWNGTAWVNATPAGSTTVQGLLELATDAETQAGSDTARAVTPAGLQSKLSDSVSTTSSTTIASSTAVKTAYDLAATALSGSGGTVTGNLEIGATGSLTFEGSTADGFETTLTVVDPTADRTITLPNTTGTVITTGDTGTVTSTMIADGTITNGDVNASAAIAGTKISPDFGSQNVITTGTSAAASLIPTSSTIPSNGIYLPAANTVGLATNGTARLQVNASGAIGLGGANYGASGQVLTSNGSSAVPTWQTVGGGGGGGTTTNSVTFNNGGAGAASGTSFDGSTAVTVSYNTVGAAASSHTHGNITNAGAIGSTSGLPIITTTSGVLTTGTFGTTSGTFCQGNDSRLSDTRTPSDLSVTDAKVASNAAIAYSKLASLTSANIIVGSSTNVPTARAVTGDVTISNTGVTAISSGVIVDADVSASAAISGSKITPNFGSQTIVTLGEARVGQNTRIDVGVNNTTNGIGLSSDGIGYFAANGLVPGYFNRNTSDGTLISLRQDGVQEGNILVTTTTVTYNQFTGSHWASLTDWSRPDIKIGTILETIDELTDWKFAVINTNEGQKKVCYNGTALPGDNVFIEYEGETYEGVVEVEKDAAFNKAVKVKINDTAASKAVYGVFVDWNTDTEADGGVWNDMYVGAVGNYVIRMAAGQQPEIGDLVEADGAGCAVVQSDDIIRSKTVAKITSTIPQVIYDDDSFLVTCVLYCG